MFELCVCNKNSNIKTKTKTKMSVYIVVGNSFTLQTENLKCKTRFTELKSLDLVRLCVWSGGF